MVLQGETEKRSADISRKFQFLIADVGIGVGVDIGVGLGVGVCVGFGIGIGVGDGVVVADGNLRQVL